MRELSGKGIKHRVDPDHPESIPLVHHAPAAPANPTPMAPPQPTRLGTIMGKLGPVEMKRGTEAIAITSAVIFMDNTQRIS